MAESDEECDRRRGRDKFRRERSDYQDRREERGRRDDWTDNNRDNRNSGARRSGDYRDYGGRRDRYSPSRHEMSPPMKRVRRDWDDRGYMGGNYDSGYNSSMVSGHHSGWGHESVGMASNSSMYRQGGYRDDQGPTQPPMMSFKQFLSSQDDAIDDQEAVKKYGEYKLDFTRQQLNEFFLNHKEEEWFKLKYHPEDSQKRQIEQIAALKKRLETFHELNESNSMNVTLDVDQSEKIIKLLDSVVIKLEGGSDFDLKALDMPFEEPKRDVSPRREASRSVNSRKVPPSEAPQERQGGKKRKKRGRGYDSDEDSGSESESGEESEKENPEPPKPAAEEEEKPKEDDKETSPDEQKVSDEDAIDVNEQDKSENPIEEIKAPEEKNEIEKKEDEVVKKEEEEAKPKPLHRTCSIFLRNLAPTITKQEVEAMCKRYPGFLRAAIADPTPERRFFRRGWVTFERSVNIKDICWNLNNIRLRECELGAIVNRDLSRRIRSISGIAAHKQVARADIKIAAKIIQNLDQKRNLWKDGPSSDKVENGSVQSFGLESSNPLLKNITDYLIEEASAEEEELLGTSDIEDKDKNGDYILEKDDSLIRVLDKLILYLRIVHSVDYYNCSEYPAEDEMPNRCGIIHARGAIPSSKVSQQEVNDFIKQFETKISSFLVPYSTLTDEEAMKLGQKNAEIEVENFIKANTQELAKDKWLCPLSGKKFKGPDFVRKHIFNKHGEKVDEVKKEVEYFNNYLMDQKRPQLPEHSGSTKSRGGYSHGNHEGMHGNHHQTMNVSSGSGYGHHHGYQGGYSSRNAYNDPYGRSAGYGHKRGYSGGDSHRRTSGGRRNTYRNDPREIVGYHDLDAPQDVDIF